MSELSIHELQAEHVELLPERDTLGIFILQVGGAEATQAVSAFAVNKAINVQDAQVAIGSFNYLHF